MNAHGCVDEAAHVDRVRHEPVALADKAAPLVALVHSLHPALAHLAHALGGPAADALASRQRVKVERERDVTPEGRERRDLVERQRRRGREELVVRERVQVVVEEDRQEQERRPGRAQPLVCGLWSGSWGTRSVVLNNRGGGRVRATGERTEEGVQDALASAARDDPPTDVAAPDEPSPQLAHHPAALAELVEHVLGLGRPRLDQGEQERVDADAGRTEQRGEVRWRREQGEMRERLGRERGRRRRWPRGILVVRLVPSRRGWRCARREGLERGFDRDE